jgi:hypothetical protein
MNYGEENTFSLQVRVTIEPLWFQPVTSTAQAMGREQSEHRMVALGNELAMFIREALESKRTPDEWAEVSYKLRHLK